MCLMPPDLDLRTLASDSGTESESASTWWLFSTIDQLPLIGLTLASGLGTLQLSNPAAVGSAGCGVMQASVQLLRTEGSPLQQHDVSVSSPGTAAVEEAELEAGGLSEECRDWITKNQPLHRQFFKQNAPKGDLVTLPFTLCADRNVDAYSFTLVTHTDIRLPRAVLHPEQQGEVKSSGRAKDGLRELRVLRLASRWKGIIAVGGRLMWQDGDGGAAPEESIFPSVDESLSAQRGRLRALLGAHLSSQLPEGVANLSAFDIHLVSYQGTYSQNHGRNTALRNVRTPFILVIDADFVPPVGISDVLENKYRPLLCGAPVALVLPSFDVFNAPPLDRRIKANRPTVLSGEEPTPSHVYAVCSTKAKLYQGYVAKNITKFHEYNRGHTFCHGSVHFLKNKTPYRISPTFIALSCPHMWEPILAFHKSQVMPYFPEVFAGRGYDRVSHVLSLRWSAFDFIVADDLFLCHPAERHNYTHGDTTDETWNSQYFANVWQNAARDIYNSSVIQTAQRRTLIDLQYGCQARRLSVGPANDRRGFVRERLAGECRPWGEGAYGSESTVASSRAQLVAASFAC